MTGPLVALRHALLTVLAVAACPLSTHALAQGGQGEPPGAAPGSSVSPVTVERDLRDEATPALFSVGLSGGFPAYQTVALSLALQAQYVGAQLKGSWTPAGVYLGGQLRVYPPIPIPVPLYLGVGGGVYGQAVSYHFALGAHVPLGQALRFDLEGGVANVPQLGERAWVPHLAAGVSYVFPIETTRATVGAPGTAGDPVGPTRAACTVPQEPDAGQVPRKIDAMVDEWILTARATYGSVYTDLSYRYSISGVKVTGKTADVTVDYEGSVTEILTGQRVSASGTAKVRLVWGGCSWGGGTVEY